MLAAIPSVAILPILLYIGMLIGSQAFQETPKEHAPAIILSFVPHLANWTVTAINGALAAAGIFAVDEVLAGKMHDQGVLYHGLQTLGGGSILGGLVLGAIGIFTIERKFVEASAFALSGAVLTFFGFMHGEEIGIAVTPAVAVGYALVAAFLYGLSRYPAAAFAEPPMSHAAVSTPAE